MKRITLCLLVLLGYWPAAQTALAQEPPRDGVFIHISHGKDNAHRALMGLTMATRMASDKDVLVYLDIEAIHLVMKGTAAVSMPPFEPSDVLLKKLLDAKATVMACPTCMEVAGTKPADLMPGVQVARKDAFFSFTRGRILTLDY